MEEIKTAEQAVSAIAEIAIDRVLAALSIGNLVSRDFDPSLACYQDTVNMRVTPILVAHEIGGEVPPSSTETVQMVLNRHVEVTMAVPDLLVALNNPALLGGLIWPMAIAIAEKIDVDLLLSASELPSIGKCNPISESLIDQAETVLFSNYVPMREQKNLVLSPESTRDLFAIAPGRPGHFNVVRSVFVQKRKVRSWRDLWRSRVKSENVAFAKDALGLATRRLPLPLPGTGALGAYGEKDDFGLRAIISYQPKTLMQIITVDVLYGCGVLRKEFGVRIPTRDK